jgi:hypothetical protein
MILQAIMAASPPPPPPPPVVGANDDADAAFYGMDRNKRLALEKATAPKYVQQLGYRKHVGFFFFLFGSEVLTLFV